MASGSSGAHGIGHDLHAKGSWAICHKSLIGELLWASGGRANMEYCAFHLGILTHLKICLDIVTVKKV